MLPKLANVNAHLVSYNHVFMFKPQNNHYGLLATPLLFVCFSLIVYFESVKKTVWGNTPLSLPPDSKPASVCTCGSSAHHLHKTLPWFAIVFCQIVLPATVVLMPAPLCRLWFCLFWANAFLLCLNLLYPLLPVLLWSTYLLAIEFNLKSAHLPPVYHTMLTLPHQSSVY